MVVHGGHDFNRVRPSMVSPKQALSCNHDLGQIYNGDVTVMSQDSIRKPAAGRPFNFNAKEP
jgi:hypothetical protein